MGDELVKAATPGEELMACAGGLGGLDFDAALAEAVDKLLALDEVVGAPVHVEIVNLLVELGGVGEDSVVGSVHIETEDGAAEGTHPREFVEVLQNNVEGLVASP